MAYYTGEQIDCCEETVDPLSTVTGKLKDVLSRLQMLGNNTSKLAHRVAGPVPESVSGPSESKLGEDVLMHLAESIEGALHRVERNVERAHSRL